VPSPLRPPTRQPLPQGRLGSRIIRPPFPQTLLVNIAEGGSNGTTITAGNTGGASGNAATSVTTAGAVAIFDNSKAARGSLSYQFSTSTSAQAFFEWSSGVGPIPRCFGGVYVNCSAFTTVPSLVRLRGNGAATQNIRISLDSTGHVQVRGTGNTVLATSTNPLVVNTWARIEWDVIGGPLGTANIYIYLVADAPVGSHTELLTAAGVDLGPGTVDDISFGIVTATASASAFNLDNFNVNSTALPGAAAPDKPPQTQRRRPNPAPMVHAWRARGPVPTAAAAPAAPTFIGQGGRPRPHMVRVARPHAAQLPPPQEMVPELPARPRPTRLARVGRARAAQPVPAQVVVPPVWVPPAPRQRLRALFARRRPAQMPPPDQVAVLTGARARLRIPRWLRGRPAQFVAPAPVVLAPAFPPQAGRIRQRVASWLRSHPAQPVPVQVTVTPPVWPPQAPHVRARIFRFTHGRTDPLVHGQRQPPAAQRPRPRMWRPARWRPTGPVPAQVIVTAPTFVPIASRIRPRGLRWWRPRPAAVVPAQVTVAPPAYPPQNTRGRMRAMTQPRKPAQLPVPTQAAPVAPVYPPQAARVRPRVWRWLHWRGVQHVAGQLLAPRPGRSRLRIVPAWLRGRRRQFIPAQVVIVPPAYPPQATRTRRRMFGLRHKPPTNGWMVGLAPTVCETPRPNGGTTTRPSSGMTSYAAAMTARPSSGTTARPNTGTTEDPC
jgi:hypothetical protein